MMERASRFRSGKSPEPAHLIARPLGYPTRPALTKSIPAALSRFHRHGIFFRERMAGKISREPRIALQNACQKMNERISTIPLLLSHFSPGDKIENCPAQFLAIRWIVRVEFKVHRLRHGFR